MLARPSATNHVIRSAAGRLIRRAIQLPIRRWSASDKPVQVASKEFAAQPTPHFPKNAPSKPPRPPNVPNPGFFILHPSAFCIFPRLRPSPLIPPNPNSPTPDHEHCRCLPAVDQPPAFSRPHRFEPECSMIGGALIRVCIATKRARSRASNSGQRDGKRQERIEAMAKRRGCGYADESAVTRAT